ncbi:MAG: hypothetical protein RLZZ293_768 [Pseudomonadota bacterium]|jgi:outer membrane protein
MKKLSWFISGVVLQIQPIMALDLIASYHQALQYNAGYQQAIATTAAGQENQYLARANLLPQISATATFNENYFNQGGISAYYHQPIYGAQLNQVLVDFSKFSAYTKGKFAAQLADLQLNNSQQQLMINIAQAYFNVLYAQDTLLATKMTKQALQQQLIQAQASFKAGTATIADVNDAQAGADSASAQEIQDTNNLINQNNIFHNLTGLDPQLIQPLSEDLQLQLPSPQNDQQWVQLAESNNLNNKIASKQQDMAREDIYIARAGHYPTVKLNAQYQYQDMGHLDVSNASPEQMQLLTIPGGMLSSYGSGSIGLQVSIPLSSGGGISAETRQAGANFESAQQYYLEVKRQTEQNVRNAYWQVQNGVSIVKAQRAALLSAKTKLDSDKLGYQVGVRNSVDLVSSQKNYYQSFQAYQLARYQYLLAKLQLDYLAGRLNDQSLQIINAQIKH